MPQLGRSSTASSEAPQELRDIGDRHRPGLASIVNVLNPRIVVLGGYFDACTPWCGAEVDEGLAERALPAALESVSLTLPGLGRDSVLLGAAEMAFEPLFIDPVTALGSAIQDVRTRLAG